MKTILILAMFALPSMAQTVDPAFLVAAGASYNAAGEPRTAGWTSMAFQVAPGLYSITTLDMTRTTSSIRTGVAKKVASAGGLTFLLHADGGLTTAASASGPTIAVGSFSTGPMMAYRIPKAKGLYAVAVMRLVAVTSVTVRPVYEVGFGWGF